MAETTVLQPFAIRSIKEKNKSKLAEEMKKQIFEYDWVFCGWEKFVLVAMSVWSVYNLWRVIF